MGYLHVDEQRIADNLNRRLSFFPISYLEMPLFDSRIEIWDFDPPPHKGRFASRAKPCAQEVHIQREQIYAHRLLSF